MFRPETAPNIRETGNCLPEATSFQYVSRKLIFWKWTLTIGLVPYTVDSCRQIFCSLT